MPAQLARLRRRFRRWGINALIAAFLLMAVVDALPGSPPALREALKPVTERLGLAQPWYVFAPKPDSGNARLRAEIVYADGTQATWHSPNWPEVSNWQRLAGHRRGAWLNTAWGQEDVAVWAGWARHLARSQRPDDPHADRGAEVKIIVAESPIRSAEFKPWTSCRVPPKFDQEWVLTIEKLP